MIFPKSIAERGEEPITHAKIKSYNDEFLISFKSELEETIRNTKKEEWREAKYYAHVLTMVKTEIAHRRL